MALESNAAEVDVFYFAAARELCGTEHERVSLASPDITVEHFLALLAARHPRLQPFVPRMRLAVNDELADAADRIAAGDRVSVLPPLAGGSARGEVALCAIRTTALSIDEVVAALRHPGAGGIALFIGTVRDHADGQPVARLDYEAHPTLAERELARVLDDAAAAAPGVRVAALHRVGSLAIGEPAVIVGASAAHRAAAFDACRTAIEELKRRVPIWKKEWSDDGSASWVNLE